MHFWQFCADLRKKSKYFKVIYIYASERYCYTLSESGIAYYALSYCFGDINVWNRIVLLSVCWVSIFFDILIAVISSMVAQTPINHSIFWKCVMRNFRCIYVNCFNRRRFLAEISTKMSKMLFFGQFTDHHSGRKHGNYTYDTIFSSTFSALIVRNIHF